MKCVSLIMSKMKMQNDMPFPMEVGYIRLFRIPTRIERGFQFVAEHMKKRIEAFA